MNKLRAAFIATFVASTAAVACSDGTPSISAPPYGTKVTSGTWTSTIWQPTDSGLKYLGARTGVYRSEVNGKAIVDSGQALQLEPAAVNAEREQVQTETALSRINQTDGAIAASRFGGSSRYRPQLRNAKTVTLGNSDGKAYSMQQFSTSTNADEPPSASIILANGQPVAIRSARYKKVNGQWRTTHSSTTLVDSTAKQQLVVNTDFGGDVVGPTSHGVAVMHRVQTGLVTVGDALAQFVLPATLHAETTEDDGTIPCHTEMMDQLKAIGVWSAAAGALAAAIGACPFTAATCFAIPFLQLALVAADVAMGIAVGLYIACMVNYNRAHAAGGSGAGASGARTCVTVDWYLSTDGGRTWTYVDSSYLCDSNTVNPI